MSTAIADQQELDNYEAPAPGLRKSGQPTTGEVNLYYDPKTFSTESPIFYADSEGLGGGEPAAAEHQTKWFKDPFARRYVLKGESGQRIDRSRAVKDIYPRFLYLFSDVICMVTQNPRAWADTAEKLLEWSQVGANHAVNQYSLPALIIILNAPSEEREEFILDDTAAKKEFYGGLGSGLTKNTMFRRLAGKVSNPIHSSSVLLLVCSD
jgi:hypothetical protein